MIVGGGVHAVPTVSGFVNARRDVAKRVAHGSANLRFVVYDEYEICIRHNLH